MLHVVEGDGVDHGEFCFEGGVGFEVGPLAADAVHAAVGAFAGEDDTGGDFGADAFDIALGDGVGEAREFALGDGPDLGLAGGLAGGENGE